MELTCPGLATVGGEQPPYRRALFCHAENDAYVGGGPGAALFSDCALVHPDLVDNRGGPGVCQAGGRLRKRHQRLQQEAGVCPHPMSIQSFLP